MGEVGESEKRQTQEDETGEKEEPLRRVSAGQLGTVTDCVAYVPALAVEACRRLGFGSGEIA